jgi:hypothetical protein
MKHQYECLALQFHNTVSADQEQSILHTMALTLSDSNTFCIPHVNNNIRKYIKHEHTFFKHMNTTRRTKQKQAWIRSH